ncbi:hypothetical protein DY000_02012687 [Brassica cretica]|uniref:Secreted protein n=1 Tax=Brassica cretica TaxID=69181 RepID=A0ABQ7CUQ6_BRACR|nr:hypothetical protein DY000_02012687 [Brassica cretica]
MSLRIFSLVFLSANSSPPRANSSRISSGGRRWISPVGPPPLISRSSNSSPCCAKVSSLPPCSSFSGSHRIVARSGDQFDDWVCIQCLWREGEVVTVFPPRRLTGMKRVTASSPPVCSFLCFSPVSSFGRNVRASPSCSHGLRRSNVTEELVGASPLAQATTTMVSFGDVLVSSFLLPTSSARVCGQPDMLRRVDLVFLRSFCCILCVVWAVLEPVVPLMLDRNSSFRVNSIATGEPLSLRRDGSVLLVEVLLQRSSGGVCQALLLMPARSHFGEFLTEILSGHSLASSGLCP